jgi:hypothetical protein
MTARRDPDQHLVEPFDTSVEPDGAGWAVTNRHDGRRFVISRHPTRELAAEAAAALNASGNKVDEFSERDGLPGPDGTFEA